MREDGDGRFCERCQLRVTEVASLDGDGLEQLLAAAERGRVCGRFELEDGRPRTKLGLAAGLIVIAVTGCASTNAPAPQAPSEREPAFVELSPARSGASIRGVVRSIDGAPLANAIVILQGVALDGSREISTDERGFYEFVELPPGQFTIQVLYEKANVSKITLLPEDARFRANFVIDPTQAEAIVREVIVHSPSAEERGLPIGARLGRVTGVVVIDETVHFDSGFVSAGLRVGE